MKTTVQQLSDRTGIDRLTCYGFLCFLVEGGGAKVVGSIRKEGARGRGKTVYEINPGFASYLEGLVLSAEAPAEPTAEGSTEPPAAEAAPETPTEAPAETVDQAA